jgi:DNA-directed RNA polymerase specialized sigma24 family protein
LVVYQGMTHTEAGAVLGVAEKTVLRRKQRALELLHQRLTTG